MAFATPAELGALLGETIAVDDPRATLLLDLATGKIASAVGMNDAWADALDPVPKALKGVCLSVAARVWSNPESLRSLQEQLGSFQEARTFAIIGLELTDSERQDAIAAVGLDTTAAPRAESWMTDLYDPDRVVLDTNELEIG